MDSDSEVIWHVCQKQLRLLHCLKKVALPNGLQNFTIEHTLRESIEKVALPASLQRLTLNVNSDLEKVVVPSGLQHLTFGSESRSGEGSSAQQSAIFEIWCFLQQAHGDGYIAKQLAVSHIWC